MGTVTPNRISNPRSIGYVINKMIRDVVDYDRFKIGDQISGNLTVIKRIELAVPSGTNSAQWIIINQKITAAADKGVQLVVTEVQ